MASTKAIKESGSIQELVPLGEYQWPRSEAQQTIGHLLEKVRLGFSAKASEDAIDDADLKTMSDETFEASVRNSLVETLTASLDHEYHDWTFSETDKRSHRMLVHPPMGMDILATWAKDHALPTLDERSQLATFSDAPCIVIPRLETFFFRRHDQLDRLVELFAELSVFPGRVLVGCNSWAARFLGQLDDTLLVLGQGDVFPAYGADALATVLENAIDGSTTFVSVSSGESILKRDKDGDLSDPFLETLADQSLGHPWVAIEMFFQGIAEAKDDDNSTKGRRAWVQLPAACSLPEADKDVLLFVLHSLLIHGTRKIDEFEHLLPKRLPNGVWLALERAGYVDLIDGYVSCAIRNYPDIRSELNAAGFNLDKL